MISAKELRAGNKVKNREGKIITVQQLLLNKITYDGKMELKTQVVSSGSLNDSSYITTLNETLKEAGYDDLMPINLTDSILQKCGFRNYLREQWIISIGNHHIDFEFTDEELALRKPAPSLIKIKYLHQLQNFLFAVAGYDLDTVL
jgi:hypothetical protein